MKVKGKEQLCVCNDYKTYFKSIQGLGGHTLFDRYKDLENIVNKRVSEKYRHFLAQPELDDNTIQWFSEPYYKEPKRLSELKGQEYDYYNNVKNETVSHYRSVVDELQAQNKNSEAEALGNAIKFVNDDFVYCYDGKTVLGVWGMELRDEVREPLGIAMKNTFEKPRKPKPPISGDEQSDSKQETDPDKPSGEDEKGGEEPSNDDNSLLSVKFDANENGSLNGKTEYKMRKGEKVSSDMIPEAEADDGFEFLGWDVEPNNHEVVDNVVFTAQFKKKLYKVHFFDGGHGSLLGRTEYDKYYEERVLANEVPEVDSNEGYKFIGWDKNPNDYVIKKDTSFVAQYENENNTWWSRFWGRGSGCLNWLLILLLLGLISLLLWYLLSGYRNFNFCGCNCDETDVVPPYPKPTPKPVLKPCDALQCSGSNSPESFVFDMGQNSGSFIFEYATGSSIPDQILIHDGGNKTDKVLFQYNDITGGGWDDRKDISIRFNNSKILIEIIPKDDPSTYWEFKVNCP